MSFLFWIILGGIWIFYNCFKERKTDKTSSEVVELTLLTLAVSSVCLVMLLVVKWITWLIPSEYAETCEGILNGIWMFGGSVLILVSGHKHTKKEKARYEEPNYTEEDGGVSNQEENK